MTLANALFFIAFGGFIGWVVSHPLGVDPVDGVFYGALGGAAVATAILIL